MFHHVFRFSWYRYIKNWTKILSIFRFNVIADVNSCSRTLTRQFFYLLRILRKYDSTGSAYHPPLAVCAVRHVLIRCCYPSAWYLGFLAKKFGFLTLLAKILTIIRGNVRKILQDFSRLWKEIQENFWTSWQEKQEYPRPWQGNQEKSWISCQKFLGFWDFLPRSWQLILKRFARTSKIFQDRRTKSKKILGVLGNKSKNNQDLGKRNKNSLHQSNTRSIDIL